MLKKKVTTYIANHTQNNEVQLDEGAQKYAENHQLIPENVTVVDNGLQATLIERCLKETEDVIQNESSNFLNEPISYLKKNLNDFLFVESTTFELVGIDGVALECDDVFKTYTALFGLKLQKKYGPEIKSYLDTHLVGEGAKYSVMFSNEDGLWDMNFAVDYIDGFNEELTFKEVYELVFRFVFEMAEAIEDAN